MLLDLAIIFLRYSSYSGSCYFGFYDFFDPNISSFEVLITKY